MKRLVKYLYNDPKVNVKNPKDRDTKVPTTNNELKIVPQRSVLRKFCWFLDNDEFLFSNHASSFIDCEIFGHFSFIFPSWKSSRFHDTILTKFKLFSFLSQFIHMNQQHVLSTLKLWIIKFLRSIFTSHYSVNEHHTHSKSSIDHVKPPSTPSHKPYQIDCKTDLHSNRPRIIINFTRSIDSKVNNVWVDQNSRSIDITFKLLNRNFSFSQKCKWHENNK